MKAEILDIRKYTSAHSELQRAHHFLFDLRLNLSSPPEFLVMGLNPGEGRKVWKDFPSITEETSVFDFQGAQRNSIPWTRAIIELCGSDRIVQSEHFFWSSCSLKKADFEDRFGYRLDKAPHLEFCYTKNLALIKNYNPKVILSLGFSSLRLAVKLFKLHYLMTKSDKSGKRVIEVYTDGSRIWLFARHIRSYGYTKEHQNQIRSEVKVVLDNFSQ